MIDHIYPEQYAYMLDLKRALDAKGHCLLEMPTGTGKTIALLSLITSYALAKSSNPPKLLYCTRTVHEMEKTLAELRLLYEYQLRHLGPSARIDLNCSLLRPDVRWVMGRISFPLNI